MAITDKGWVKSMATRIYEVMGTDSISEHGYSLDECEQLAQAMHDLPDGGRVGGLSPSEHMLLLLLQMQPDIGEAEARILAGALPRLNLRRVLAFASETSALLDIHLSNVLRRRQSGDLPAVLLSIGPTGYGAGAWYGLWQLLWILAWQRQHPYTGGRARAWPDSVR